MTTAGVCELCSLLAIFCFVLQKSHALICFVLQKSHALICFVLQKSHALICFVLQKSHALICFVLQKSHALICFVLQKSHALICFVLQEDFEALLSSGCLCLRPDFISAHLSNPEADVDDYCPQEIKALKAA